MARAFRLAVEAGREAFHAGLMDERVEAEPSSPLTGAVRPTSPMSGPASADVIACLRRPAYPVLRPK